ncbi:hypothetical protein BH09SUM1_BH09SUM1_27210 [soil metagenome]
MSRKHSHLCFDRTPLFIGVMILPLAAGCAFINGGLLERVLFARAAAEQVELRAVATDRDRRQDGSEFSQRQSGEELAHHKVTSPPAYAALFSSAIIPTSKIFTAARVNVAAEKPAGLAQSATRPRGPPLVA